MKSNNVHTKFYAFMLSLWQIIKDALSPSWAASMPEPTREDETFPSQVGQGPTTTATAPTENTNPSSSSSPGFTETPGKEPSSPPLVADKAREETALATNEEVVRLQERIKELERDVVESSEVKRTLDELRACEKKEREAIGRVGRRPKPSKRVTFNLQLRWSLLIEFGIKIQTIDDNYTQFYNTAIELYLKTYYPELYSLYIRSITNEMQTKTIRD